LLYLGDDTANWISDEEVQVQPKRIKIISKGGEIQGIPISDLPDEEYDIIVNRNIPLNQGDVDFISDEEEGSILELNEAQ
jgi:hypothetical protein